MKQERSHVDYPLRPGGRDAASPPLGLFSYRQSHPTSSSRLSALFSSERVTWATPWPLFRALDVEFGFELDVCALPENAKCARYFTPDDDGLSKMWRGICWMNPPYGRVIGAWVRKAFESAAAGATVVCLLPARTDTAWWHDYVLRAAEVRFLRGRVRFVGAKASAPFPSAVVVFRPEVRPARVGGSRP